MRSVSLNGTWQLCGKLQNADNWELSLEAVVPNCVQLDLSKQGLLPADLFMGENIRETEKFEGFEWQYKKTFNAPQERENVFIVFNGVDCVAEYWLNGIKIGESSNMLISHEFDISKHLIDGENEITVYIKSSSAVAHSKDYPISSFVGWGKEPVEMGVRRAPHTYGWDIMPRCITAGIWRDVKIEVRDRLSFSQLFFDTDVSGCELYYEVKSLWEDFRNIEIEVLGDCGEESNFSVRKKIPSKAGRLMLPINNPKTWWPYGYGEPNIYDVIVRIYSDSILVHEEKTHFGLRTVLLDRTDITDGVNGKFRLLVNGVEIMCKGSNWVPLDAFHSRDIEWYDKTLELARDIGCNILRCWGGNVYEQEHFYDFCDRNGIMVWQDFIMACRPYIQKNGFLAQIEEEINFVVRALRNHPSIVLWAGDNEVDFMVSAKYCSKGYSPPRNYITRMLIPQIIESNDIGRPYLESSPYIPDDGFKRKRKYENNSICESFGIVEDDIHKWGMDIYSDNETVSEAHLWEPRDYYKNDLYKLNRSHFISEIGYHGCPSLDSVKRFITPENVWPYKNNPEWILHSSNQHGDDSRVMLMEKQIKQLFGIIPEEPERYITASQISQAEADKFFIEHSRINRPHKSGIIWWNLRDGWPQMSDAVVDYYFVKKKAYDYIKRSQAPFSIMADEIFDWGLKLYACNDTLEEKKGSFTVKDGETGELLCSEKFTAALNSSKAICKLPIYFSDHKILIIEWLVGESKGINHYLCGYPPISLDWYIDIMKKHGL